MLEIWKDVALSMSDPTNNPVCKDYYAIKVSSRVNVDQALHPWLKFWRNTQHINDLPGFPLSKVSSRICVRCASVLAKLNSLIKQSMYIHVIWFTYTSNSVWRLVSKSNIISCRQDGCLCVILDGTWILINTLNFVILNYMNDFKPFRKKYIYLSSPSRVILPGINQEKNHNDFNIPTL